MIATDNAITVTDKARVQVKKLMEDGGHDIEAGSFLRVSVIGGGCSGLSYKMDFDTTLKPGDQEFDAGENLRIVTDLKSFLYLVNTELEYSDGLNGKGFHFINPNASRTCACGESFAV